MKPLFLITLEVNADEMAEVIIDWAGHVHEVVPVAGPAKIKTKIKPGLRRKPLTGASVLQIEKMRGTPTEIAKKTGYSPATVRRVKAGNHSPRAKQLALAARKDNG